ncbi:MAG: ABC transporter permease, partial [Clostridiales bacterium]
MNTLKDFFANINRSSYVVIGGTILILLMLCAALAPWISPYDPLAIHAADRLQTPSSEYWFGTDELGRDIFSRMLYGARISMLVGFSCVILTLLVGIPLGLACGYFPKFDKIASRIIDGFMAFPDMIVAITLAAVWGS